MKTPEEIKKGLEIEIAVHYHLPNPEPRLTPRELMYMNQLHGDALDYIKQIEQRLAHAERERDAAIHDMEQIVHEVDDVACKWCKNAYFDEVKCRACRMHNESFEWQGVCPENTKEETDAD